MNKKVIISLALLVLLGCSKDKIDSYINGQWEAVSFTTSEPVDENMDGVKNTDLKLEMDCVTMNANFSSDGNFTLESTDVTYDITYVDGKVVLKPTGCGVQTEKGTWSVNESTTVLFLEFKVEGKDETTAVDVNIELSENRLVLKDLFYKEDTETITYTIEFKRI
jgi:hypothetical protein